ncbi:hypothetical protein [Myxococcus sp. AB056]|uniref:hypothetical protein n=1 Tax=Myxococcus sp. AB056 TaxID=2562792 RepID=UPI001891F24D|nr:hypothetical protein [Myxococcus sp. AB056]
MFPNKAGDDKGGWDFLLEVERKKEGHAEAISLDRLPSMPEFRVQVKATDGTRAPKIALSNLLRLCQSPQPAFVVIVLYGGKEQPQAAYLVHVGERLIGKCLKRLRELSVDRQGRLNKIEISVPWEEKDRFDQPDSLATGLALRRGLEGYVCEGLAEYAKRKTGWFRSVGFSEVAIRGKFGVAPDVERTSREVLEDFALGLRDSMRVEIREATEIRFDIGKPLPWPSSAVIAFPKNNPPAKSVFVRFSWREHRVLLKAEMYATYLFFRDLPVEKQGFRLKMRFFEFVSRGDKVDVRMVAPDYGDAVSLAELHDAFRLMVLIRESRASGERIELRICLDGIWVSGFRFELPGRGGFGLDDSEVVDVVSDLIVVVERLGIGRDVSVSIDSILGQSERIRQCRRLLEQRFDGVVVCGKIMPVCAPLECSGDSAGFVVVDGRVEFRVDFGVPWILVFRVGGNVVVVSVAMYGRPICRGVDGVGVVSYDFVPKFEVVEEFVEAVPEGGAYSLVPHRARLRDWMVAKGIFIPLPFAPKQPEPAHASEEVEES